MGTYYMIIVFLLFGGLLTQMSTHKHKDVIFLLFAFLLLMYFSAQRYAIGYDYGPYAFMYRRYSAMEFHQLYDASHEKGYVFFNYILGFLSTNYRLLFAMTSVFCVGGVCWYLFLNSRILWLSIFLFFILGFYYMSYNFIRQFMASVIMLIGFRYVHQRDFLRYAMFVFLAGSFHLSAFIMLPFYFLFQIPLNKWMLLVYLICGAVCFFYSEPMLYLITRYVYTVYDPFTNSEMIKGIPYWYTLPFLIVFLLSYPVRNELLLQDPKNDFYLSTLCFVLMFEWVALKHGLISRFILLFMIPAMCILIPNVLLVYYEMYFKVHKTLGYAVLAILFAFCLINHQCFMKDNYNGVVPYRTYADADG